MRGFGYAAAMIGAAGTLLLSGCASVAETLGECLGSASADGGGMSAETAEQLVSAGETATELSAALPFPFNLLAAAAGGALMLWGGAKTKAALTKVATSVAVAAASATATKAASENANEELEMRNEDGEEKLIPNS